MCGKAGSEYFPQGQGGVIIDLPEQQEQKISIQRVLP
jgi:hypothetical protein